MNYNKIYQDLISSRKILKRTKKEGTYEKHHILPKCLGGTNDKSNLVLLTPKEHYIAHLLLTKMYYGKDKAKMCYALFIMCINNNKQKRIISSRRYEYAKKLVSENCVGVNASGYGKKLSEEKRKLISIRMMGEGNHAFGKDPWNKGKKLPSLSKEHKEKMSKTAKSKNRKLTDEHKKIISNAQKNKPKSDDCKKKLSDFNIGKKLSDETKKAMSDSRKGVPQEKIKCPYCEKIGGTTMYRWHFDNCKYK